MEQKKYDPEVWSPLSHEERTRHEALFFSQGPIEGLLPGEKARELFLQSKLPLQVLSQIWNLVDHPHDNMLDADEFTAAMHLIQRQLRHQRPLPKLLPASMLPRGQHQVVIPLVKKRELVAYRRLFDSLDKRRRGTLPGGFMCKVLETASVPIHQVALVWDFADADRDGALSIDEFCAACHLTRFVKKGKSIDGPINVCSFLPHKMLKTDLAAKKTKLAELETKKRRLMALKDRRKKESAREKKRAELWRDQLKILETRRQYVEEVCQSNHPELVTMENDRIRDVEKQITVTETVAHRLNKEHERVRQETARAIVEEQNLSQEVDALQAVADALRQKRKRNSVIKDLDPFHQLYEERKEERLTGISAPKRNVEVKMPSKNNPFDKSTVTKQFSNGADMFGFSDSFPADIHNSNSCTSDRFDDEFLHSSCAESNSDPWTSTSLSANSKDVTSPWRTADNQLTSDLSVLTLGFEDNFVDVWGSTVLQAVDQTDKNRNIVSSDAKIDDFNFLELEEQDDKDADHIFKTVSVTAEEDDLWSSLPQGVLAHHHQQLDYLRSRWAAAAHQLHELDEQAPQLDFKNPRDYVTYRNELEQRTKALDEVPLRWKSPWHGGGSTDDPSGQEPWSQRRSYHGSDSSHHNTAVNRFSLDSRSKAVEDWEVTPEDLLFEVPSSHKVPTSHNTDPFGIESHEPVRTVGNNDVFTLEENTEVKESFDSTSSVVDDLVEFPTCAELACASPRSKDGFLVCSGDSGVESCASVVDGTESHRDQIVPDFTAEISSSSNAADNLAEDKSSELFQQSKRLLEFYPLKDEESRGSISENTENISKCDLDVEIKSCVKPVIAPKPPPRKHSPRRAAKSPVFSTHSGARSKLQSEASVDSPRSSIDKSVDDSNASSSRSSTLSGDSLSSSASSFASPAPSPRRPPRKHSPRKKKEALLSTSSSLDESGVYENTEFSTFGPTEFRGSYGGVDTPLSLTPDTLSIDSLHSIVSSDRSHSPLLTSVETAEPKAPPRAKKSPHKSKAAKDITLHAPKELSPKTEQTVPTRLTESGKKSNEDTIFCSDLQPVSESVGDTLDVNGCGDKDINQTELTELNNLEMDSDMRRDELEKLRSKFFGRGALEQRMVKQESTDSFGSDHSDHQEVPELPSSPIPENSAQGVTLITLGTDNEGKDVEDVYESWSSPSSADARAANNRTYSEHDLGHMDHNLNSQEPVGSLYEIIKQRKNYSNNNANVGSTNTSPRPQQDVDDLLKLGDVSPQVQVRHEIADDEGQDSHAAITKTILDLDSYTYRPEFEHADYGDTEEYNFPASNTTPLVDFGEPVSSSAPEPGQYGVHISMDDDDVVITDRQDFDTNRTDKPLATVEYEEGYPEEDDPEDPQSMVPPSERWGEQTSASVDFDMLRADERLNGSGRHLSGAGICESDNNSDSEFGDSDWDMARVRTSQDIQLSAQQPHYRVLRASPPHAARPISPPTRVTLGGSVSPPPPLPTSPPPLVIGRVSSLLTADVPHYDDATDKEENDQQEKLPDSSPPSRVIDCNASTESELGSTPSKSVESLLNIDTSDEQPTPNNHLVIECNNTWTEVDSVGSPSGVKAAAPEPFLVEHIDTSEDNPHPESPSGSIPTPPVPPSSLPMDPITGLRKVQTGPLSPVEKAVRFMEQTDTGMRVRRKEQTGNGDELSEETIQISRDLENNREKIMETSRVKAKRLDSWSHGGETSPDESGPKTPSERQYEERKRQLSTSSIRPDVIPTSPTSPTQPFFSSYSGYHSNLSTPVKAAITPTNEEHKADIDSRSIGDQEATKRHWEERMSEGNLKLFPDYPQQQQQQQLHQRDANKNYTKSPVVKVSSASSSSPPSKSPTHQQQQQPQDVAQSHMESAIDRDIRIAQEREAELRIQQEQIRNTPTKQQQQQQQKAPPVPRQTVFEEPDPVFDPPLVVDHSALKLTIGKVPAAPAATGKHDPAKVNGVMEKEGDAPPLPMSPPPPSAGGSPQQTYIELTEVDRQMGLRQTHKEELSAPPPQTRPASSPQKEVEKREESIIEREIRQQQGREKELYNQRHLLYSHLGTPAPSKHQSAPAAPVTPAANQSRSHPLRVEPTTPTLPEPAQPPVEPVPVAVQLTVPAPSAHVRTAPPLSPVAVRVSYTPAKSAPSPAPAPARAPTPEPVLPTPPVHHTTPKLKVAPTVRMEPAHETQHAPSQVNYEDAISANQHQGESLIAREMREQRERENDMRAQWVQMGRNPQLVTDDIPDTPYNQPEPVQPKVGHLPGGDPKRGIPRHMLPNKVQHPASESHNDGIVTEQSVSVAQVNHVEAAAEEGQKVQPLADNDDDLPPLLGLLYRYQPQSESPIDREIRLMREREEALRQARGYPAAKKVDTTEVIVEMLTPQSDRPHSLLKKNDDSGDGIRMQKFASSRLQQEIEQEKKREVALRQQGMITTISEERTGEGKRYQEVIPHDAPVTPKTPKTPVAKTPQTPPPSQVPVNIVDSPDSGVDSVAVTPVSNGGDTYYRESTAADPRAVTRQYSAHTQQKHDDETVRYMSRVSPNIAESRIERELREMKEREDELSGDEMQRDSRQRVGFGGGRVSPPPQINGMEDHVLMAEPTPESEPVVFEKHPAHPVQIRAAPVAKDATSKSRRKSALAEEWERKFASSNNA